MSDISELERRITAALDRAAQAMDRLGVAGASESGVDAAALMDELEAERVANAQLEERVRAIKEKQETTVAGLEGQVTRLKAQVESRDGELSRLKAVGDELRRSNQALREANASALPDADLVNGSLTAEVEALRAARAADRAEIDDILATLDPVLKEA
jgi:chromosome segregation ATPase